MGHNGDTTGQKGNVRLCGNPAETNSFELNAGQRCFPVSQDVGAIAQTLIDSREMLYQILIAIFASKSRLCTIFGGFFEIIYEYIS